MSTATGSPDPGRLAVLGVLIPALWLFVRRRHQRWPGLFLDGEPLTSGALADWRLAEDDDFSGIVTISSGQEMEDFWEDNGYALDASGQGPYAVFYRLHAQPLHATTVSGGVSRDGRPVQSEDLRPWRIRLCAANGTRPGSASAASGVEIPPGWSTLTYACCGLPGGTSAVQSPPRFGNALFVSTAALRSMTRRGDSLLSSVD
jgi:hypothetical protein